MNINSTKGFTWTNIATAGWFTRTNGNNTNELN